MNDQNQGQNQGQPPAAPVQVQPAQPAPPQAQPAPPAAPPVPPAAPLVPPVFALAPGRNDHILDWTNPAHMKQYYKATSPLDSTEKFDGQPNKICLFLSHVEDRAQQFNWQSILTISVSHHPYPTIVYTTMDGCPCKMSKQKPSPMLDCKGAKHKMLTCSTTS